MAKLLRIGIISDTHGDFASIELAMETMGQLDYLFHAGDHLQDIQRLSRILDIPVIGVAGNCDPFEHPSDEIIEIQGQRIFVTHGHNYGVKSNTTGIIQVARRNKADVAIFGHTHVPTIFVQHGILFINPGSTSVGRRYSAKSCAILTIEDTQVNASIISL